MLDSLLAGRKNKLLVIALLGFAAADFVITIALSAADAIVLALEIPTLHPFLGESRRVLIIALLGLLACVFWKGFREVVRAAILIAVPCILLNVAMLLRRAVELMSHPESLDAWHGNMELLGDWPTLLSAPAFSFPKLALGMSGFQTRVSMMPPTDGGASRSQRQRRIDCWGDVPNSPNHTRIYALVRFM